MGVDPTVSREVDMKLELAGYCLKCGSASRCFQPGKGPSRCLLHDCETGCGTDGSICSTTADTVPLLATISAISTISNNKDLITSRLPENRRKKYLPPSNISAKSNIFDLNE